MCRLPSAVCRLPSAVCRLPSAVCRLPSAVCCLLLAGCGVGTTPSAAVSVDVRVFAHEFGTALENPDKNWAHEFYVPLPAGAPDLSKWTVFNPKPCCVTVAVVAIDAPLATVRLTRRRGVVGESKWFAELRPPAGTEAPRFRLEAKVIALTRVVMDFQEAVNPLARSFDQPTRCGGVVRLRRLAGTPLSWPALSVAGSDAKAAYADAMSETAEESFGTVLAVREFTLELPAAARDGDSFVTVALENPAQGIFERRTLRCHAEPNVVAEPPALVLRHAAPVIVALRHKDGKPLRIGKISPPPVGKWITSSAPHRLRSP